MDDPLGFEPKLTGPKPVVLTVTQWVNGADIRIRTEIARVEVWYTNHCAISAYINVFLHLFELSTHITKTSLSPFLILDTECGKSASNSIISPILNGMCIFSK